MYARKVEDSKSFPNELWSRFLKRRGYKGVLQGLLRGILGV